MVLYGLLTLIALSHLVGLIWAYRSGRLYLSHFVTAFGPLALYYLMIMSGPNRGSLSNLFVEGFLVLSIPPLIVLVRLALIDKVFKKARLNSAILMWIVIFATVIMRIAMPILPE